MLNFRDSKHRSGVCLLLLEMKGLHRFWAHSDLGHWGPTEEARQELHLMNDSCSSLSSGEQVLLRVVFDIWDGSGRASMGHILTKLDQGVAKSIGELLVAASRGPDEVDAWSEEWRGYDPNEEFFAS